MDQTLQDLMAAMQSIEAELDDIQKSSEALWRRYTMLHEPPIMKALLNQDSVDYYRGRIDRAEQRLGHFFVRAMADHETEESREASMAMMKLLAAEINAFKKELAKRAGDLELDVLAAMERGGLEPKFLEESKKGKARRDLIKAHPELYNALIEAAEKDFEAQVAAMKEPEGG